MWVLWYKFTSQLFFPQPSKKEKRSLGVLWPIRLQQEIHTALKQHVPEIKITADSAAGSPQQEPLLSGHTCLEVTDILAEWLGLNHRPTFPVSLKLSKSWACACKTEEWTMSTRTITSCFFLLSISGRNREWKGEIVGLHHNDCILTG